VQTDIAIGAEARGFRRWLKRAVLPVAVVRLGSLCAMLVFVLGTGFLYNVAITPRGDCFAANCDAFGYRPLNPADLLDWLF